MGVNCNPWTAEMKSLFAKLRNEQERQHEMQMAATKLKKKKK